MLSYLVSWGVLVSFLTHFPVGKVLFCSDVKAWLKRLGVIFLCKKHPAYGATENEADGVPEGACRAGFLEAHIQVRRSTWMFWRGCTVYVNYTVKAKTVFLKYLMVSAGVPVLGQHMGKYHSLRALSLYSASKPPLLSLVRDPE